MKIDQHCAFLILQETGTAAFIVLVGVFLCSVDSQEYNPDWKNNLKLNYKKEDDKSKNWDLQLEPSITNNYPGLKASLDYQKNNFRAGANYQYQNTPFNDYHKVGGNIGYDNGKFSVKGTGHYDNTGDWGAGIKFGWRWKRSLRKVRISNSY